MNVYRLFLTIVAPIAALFALRQVLRGKETLADIRERFGAGLSALAPHSGPTLWVHGASNGELTGGRALIEDALKRDPNRAIIVTVNSVSARKLVRSWGMERVTVRLAPLDYHACVKAFIAQTQPEALLTIENEIWPNRFVACAQRGIPVLVVGARMSQKTLRFWQKNAALLKGVSQQTLAAISALAPQDQASQNRYVTLGLQPERILPMFNLKSGVEMKASAPAKAAQLPDSFQRSMTVLAASTHEGEDDSILDGFARARAAHPDLKLILAPRHPVRAADICALARARDLNVAQRSTGASAAQADVYVADTLGEMPLWYEVSGYTFVGGSLVDNGGHTPFEPAQFGSVILHGPYVSNHNDAYEALHAADAALRITTPQEFGQALDTLLRSPDKAQQMTQNGAAALDGLRTSKAATAAFWDALDTAIATDNRASAPAL